MKTGPWTVAGVQGPWPTGWALFDAHVWCAQRFPDWQQRISPMNGNLEKHHLSKKKEDSLARVRVENVLSLRVRNLQEHRGRSWAQKGPCLAGGNTGSIWNKSHMEKRTEETI